MLFITHRLEDYFLNVRQMASVYINASVSGSCHTCASVGPHQQPQLCQQGLV